MKDKRNKIIWAIICSIVCILFVPIIIFNSIITVKAAANPDELPFLFGISPTAVMTGSMSPEIEAKDLIFVQQVNPKTLEKGDIICYYSDGEYITHRIVKVEVVDGLKRFYTKGDANNTEDRGYIYEGQVQGKYLAKITGLGGVIMFLQNPYGLMLTVILLVVLYIAGELIIELVEKVRDNKKLIKENEELRAQLALYLDGNYVPVATDDTEEVEPKPIKLFDINEDRKQRYELIKERLLECKSVTSVEGEQDEVFIYNETPIAKLCIRNYSVYLMLDLTLDEITSIEINTNSDTDEYTQKALKAVDVLYEKLGLTKDLPVEPNDTDKQLLETKVNELVEGKDEPLAQ